MIDRINTKRVWFRKVGTIHVPRSTVYFGWAERIFNFMWLQICTNRENLFGGICLWCVMKTNTFSVKAKVNEHCEWYLKPRCHMFCCSDNFLIELNRMDYKIIGHCFSALFCSERFSAILSVKVTTIKLNLSSICYCLCLRYNCAHRVQLSQTKVNFGLVLNCWPLTHRYFLLGTMKLINGRIDTKGLAQFLTRHTTKTLWFFRPNNFTCTTTR